MTCASHTEADLTGGHSCSGRRSRCEAGPWSRLCSGAHSCPFLANRINDRSAAWRCNVSAPNREVYGSNLVRCTGYDSGQVVHTHVPLLPIPRLHDQAGSTSWLYVSWTSQLDVCSTFARCVLDRVNGV